MENENYKKTEIYNQFINNISKATRTGSQNSYLRNHTTMSKNSFNQEEMVKNNFQINEQSNDKEGNYNTIYDKMNHKIINKRRTI